MTCSPPRSAFDFSARLLSSRCASRGDQVPNPGGAVAQDHHLLGLLQSTLPGQLVEQPSKAALGGATSYIAYTVWCRRIHIHARSELGALGPALCAKHPSGFDLPVHIAWAVPFLFLHRHTAPSHAGQYAIQFDIEPLNTLLLSWPLTPVALRLLGLGL